MQKLIMLILPPSLFRARLMMTLLVFQCWVAIFLFTKCRVRPRSKLVNFLDGSQKTTWGYGRYQKDFYSFTYPLPEKLINKL